MLTFGDFKNYVDLYSADLSHWPAEMIKPALLLIENSTVAKEYFDAALKTDAALRTFIPAPRDLSALEKRIMAKVAVTKQEADVVKNGMFNINWNVRALFAPGSGLVAAAVIGFVIGLSPAPKTVLDTNFYSGDQVITGDADFYDGDIF